SKRATRGSSEWRRWTRFWLRSTPDRARRSSGCSNSSGSRRSRPSRRIIPIATGRRTGSWPNSARSGSRRRDTRRRGGRWCPAFLAANAKALQADVALVCDTGMWGPAIPAITIALRGIVGEEVVLTGPNRDLHSGVYGGLAANPINVLTRILGDLHDANGAVA